MMKTITQPMKLFGLLVLAGFLVLQSCRPEESLNPETKLASDFDSEVILEWNELLLDVDRFTPGYLPPISGRSLGYLGYAAYEAVLPGMPGFNSLKSKYSGLIIPQPDPNVEYYYPAVVNAVYAALVIKLYPTVPAAQLSAINALESRFNAEFTSAVDPNLLLASENWGRDVANAIFEWSSTDPVGHEAFLHTTDPSYVPPSGPGKWQPTYPDFRSAILPHWGNARTFAARADDEVQPPLPFSTETTSEFYAQALETENKVNLINQGQNYEDKWIAQFWSDDCAALTFTPAGRWMAIAAQILEDKNAKLDKSVQVFAKMGMALCDAGIRCWGEKYRYNLLRPVDYIRNDMGHQNWNSIMCPDGAGQFFTPAFPTYPSGHATFGGAGAEVLTAEFGNSYVMTDKCHKDRTEFIGTPRTYSSFYEMAAENGYSRIPIGVHYRMDSEAGIDLGYKVGRRVNSLPWK